VYTLWFFFMAWVYYLVPNAIALVALIVSFFLPAVTTPGRMYTQFRPIITWKHGN